MGLETTVISSHLTEYAKNAHHDLVGPATYPTKVCVDMVQKELILPADIIFSDPRNGEQESLDNNRISSQY